MQYSPKLIPATLIRRYKRFLADVRLETGEEITVHTPNTGRMLGLAEPGSQIWLKDCQSPKRKYRYSWVMASAAAVAVGVDTHLANKLVVEGIESGVISELQGYADLKTEVVYGTENSRVDILLQAGGERCYVEVKNVTAMMKHGVAVFPDAVSTRASKHLRELMLMKQQGDRAVIFFCATREDALVFQPADEIDSVYGQNLRQAAACGVELLAYRARVSAEEVCLETRLPVELPRIKNSLF